LKSGENVGNAKWFLQEAGFAETTLELRDFQQISGHINHRWFALACRGEEPLDRRLAAVTAAILSEVQVAEKNIRRMPGDGGEGLFQGGGTIDEQAVGDKPFEEQAAKTFLVVKNKNGATL
jgi:hypothetical protein